ncbi:MAG: hypothetical protein WKG01_11975 [Kofleriaceae bacterium]
MRFIFTLAVILAPSSFTSGGWAEAAPAMPTGSATAPVAAPGSATDVQAVPPPVDPARIPAAPPAPASMGGDSVGDPAARKACVDAMNADPRFADAIIRTAEIKIAPDKIQREQLVKDGMTIGIHEQHNAWVAKNQRHVILAYAAMWLLAAGFVLFLWRRQQRLVGDIQQLRRDLEAATKEDK